MLLRVATTVVDTPLADMVDTRMVALDLLLRTDGPTPGTKPCRNSILEENVLPMLGLATRAAKFEGGLRRLGRDLGIRGAAPTRMHSSSRDILGWKDLSGTTPRESRRRGPGLTAVHLAPLPRSAFTQFVIAWPHAPRELATSPATSISSLHALIGDPATHALTLLRGPRNTPWLHSPLATIAR